MSAGNKFSSDRPVRSPQHWGLGGKDLARLILAGCAGLLLSTTAKADTVSPVPPAPAKISLVTAIDTTHSDTAETTAGDLVADAIRQAAHADIAIVPADQIVGDVTVQAGSHVPGDLLCVLRYGQDDTDTIVLLGLTGKQLRAALERSVSREPQPFDGFFQISGLQVRYDASKPIGKRIIEAGIPGEPILDTKHYTIATTRPLANGSFGYFRIWDSSAIVSDTGVTVARSLTAYAASRPTLSPMLDGRIVGL